MKDKHKVKSVNLKNDTDIIPDKEYSFTNMTSPNHGYGYGKLGKDLNEEERLEVLNTLKQLRDGE